MHLSPRSAFSCTALALALFMGCVSEQVPTDPYGDATAEDLYAAGIELARHGELIRAEQYLIAAKERGMSHAQVLPALVRICAEASRFGRAVEHVQPALAQNPNDWRLRFLLATLYQAMNRPHDALLQLQLAIEVEPNAPQMHYTLGLLLRDELGDVPAGRRALERYLELAPTGPHAAEIEHWLRTHSAHPIVRVDLNAPSDPSDPSSESSPEPEASPDDAPAPTQPSAAQPNTQPSAAQPSTTQPAQP